MTASEILNTSRAPLIIQEFQSGQPSEAEAGSAVRFSYAAPESLRPRLLDSIELLLAVGYV